MAHGHADRLLGDFDLKKIDELLKGGGTGELAERLGLGNLFLGPKRFGRLFPDATPFRPDDEALVNLGKAMQDPVPPNPNQPDPTQDNLAIPAGFTYLGQFIDHDITFDQTKGFQVMDDAEEIEQGRTPNIDLDSLYGLGPKRQPELYDIPDGKPENARFRIGRTANVDSPVAPGQAPAPPNLPNDLPRRDDKVAIIGDPRNDENLLVAQTHLAFLKFHNRVMDTQPSAPGGLLGSVGDLLGKAVNFTQSEEDKANTPFHRARRTVRWHYQWMVLHDHVGRMVEPATLNDVRTNGRKFFTFQKEPFKGSPYMPIEFSVGAYRMGHTQVREFYNHNRVFGAPPAVPFPLANASLRLFFTFTGSGGFFGLPTLPSNWIVDWRRYHSVDDPALLNFTRRLDAKLVPALHALPGFTPPEPNDLAVRNLIRGSRLGLPSGQEVAERMGLPKLTAAELGSGPEGPVVTANGFAEQTPLWYYVLKEAEVQAGGKHLGAVGSRIAAEVFVGLLEADKNSFLAKKKDWKPTLPSASPGTFTIADLLNFVGDLNPLG